MIQAFVLRPNAFLLNFRVNSLSIPQIVLLGDAFAPAVAYIAGNRTFKKMRPDGEPLL